MLNNVCFDLRFIISRKLMQSSHFLAAAFVVASLVRVGFGVSAVSEVRREQSFLLLASTSEGQQILKFLGGDELPQHLSLVSLSRMMEPQPV